MMGIFSKTFYKQMSKSAGFTRPVFAHDFGVQMDDKTDKLPFEGPSTAGAFFQRPSPDFESTSDGGKPSKLNPTYQWLDSLDGAQ